MFDWLRTLSRPTLSPFFAARVAAHVTVRARPVPATLYLYWGAFVFFAGPALAQHWWGIAIGIVIAAVAATAPARRSVRGF
jgi:hypothetical protein